MKHVHKRTGQVYEVGRLDDFDGSTYDMCVITKWNECFESAPKLINYYFGDYDASTTDEYIDMYLEMKENAQ